MLFYGGDVPSYLYLLDGLLAPSIKIFLKLFPTIQFSTPGGSPRSWTPLLPYLIFVKRSRISLDYF